MNRILVSAVLVALVCTGTAFGAAPKPKHHAARTTVVAHSAPATCAASDRSSCTQGSCGACSKGAAVEAASHATHANAQMKSSAASCAGVDPASCPASCRKTADCPSAERVASR